MTNSDEYEETLRDGLDYAREIAEKAKSHGADPESHVEIPVADTMAERCEALLEREYGDKITGLADQIMELEQRDEDLSREEMSLVLAEEFAQGELSKDFDNDAERVEASIRTAVALLTEGVVAAPIEGIGEVQIDDNDDGTKFLRIPYFGPIRSAGGTGQAVSVLVADYIRQQLEIAPYKPRDDEVERYVEEIQLYHNAGGGMQYCPDKEEGRNIVRNTPIMVDGQPNANAVGREVDGYRDLERIEGNHPRDGMALVMAEGIALKAPKLKRYAEAFELDSWDWLDDLIKTEDDSDDTEEDAEDDSNETTTTVPTRADNIDILKGEKKFMSDTIAGRPIFAGASKDGAFRLRYGRARNIGLAACGFNPATMVLASNFIAPATQLKTERPGKAAGAAPVDSIEGPTVRLDTGELRRVDTEEEARRVEGSVEKIVDLGEIAVPFGEFEENNYPLAPASYNPQWWEKDLDHAGGDSSQIDHQSLTVDKAIQYTQDYDIPLHPKYTYLWHDITPEQYAALTAALDDATTTNDGLSVTIEIADTLEALLVPNTIDKTKQQITIPQQHARILNMCTTDSPVKDDVLGQVNNTAPFTVRARAPTRIGARMGRPEKSERREMHPVVHSLFPTGEAGGDGRSVPKAADVTENGNMNLEKKSKREQKEEDEYKGRGVIQTRVANRICPDCNEQRMFARCSECDTRTTMLPVCTKCGQKGGDPDQPCDNCNGRVTEATNRDINIKTAYQNAKENIGERDTSFDAMKGVKGLTSANKTPEPLEKGILRAKHNVSTFRDGTARYDMCDLPLTSFKPNEIDLSLEKLEELGYKTDLYGDEITDGDQLIEIKLQDVIISREAGEYMLQVANYIDDLLEKYYDMEAHYNADSPQDLIGEFIIGMAPHTSAGTLGRIIGFTDALANYAHPFYHAAKRRNCFHPETELTVKLNNKWQRVQIQELVENHLEPQSQGYDDSYDDGTIVQATENHPEIDEILVPSMTDNGFRTVEHITHLSKHKAPDHMVTIKTEDGDELTVTPDHKVPVKDNDKDELMTEKKAHQIQEGDLLFDYNQDKREQVKNYTEIDTLEHLLRNPSKHDVDIENVMIRGLEKDQVYKLLENVIKPQWDNSRFYKMKSSCEYLGITKKSLDNYLRRQSIPATLFLELYDDNVDRLLEEIPNNVELGMNSDNVSVPRMQTLDEELACLIGYYTAEGFTRQRADQRVDGEHNGSNHTDIANIEDESRDFIENTFRKRFNKEDLYTDNERRITASGNLTRFFFKHILDSGRLAHEKEIPRIIKNSSDDILGAYLGGYISGDGSTMENYFCMRTVSEELKDDLVSAIERLGHDTGITSNDPKPLSRNFPDYYPADYEGMSLPSWDIRIHSPREFANKYPVFLSRKQQDATEDYDLSVVESVSYKKSDTEYTYNLTVDETHKLEVESLYLRNCDGDEDSVMLLLDGLINFSRRYLPDQRGKNMMDAPIVMSTILDPEEIDDEAHNVDIVGEYPREFYEKTMDAPDPDAAEISIAEDELDNPTGFEHSLSANSIHSGPKQSSYKTVGDMDDKLDAQLDLAEKTRGVDERKVAGLVTEKHFFPDIIGNLTAFARQETYCRACGGKYRRVPTSGVCPRCGSSLQLTVYPGMVDKYVGTAMDVADKYELDLYTRQRLELLSDRIDSLFEDDKASQSSLEDFGIGD